MMDIIIQASVRVQNFQQYRHVENPGWTLGWTWAQKEIIWEMKGAVATDGGDCSDVKADPIPYSCSRNPTIVDLLPNVQDGTKMYSNCCRGGVLSGLVQDPSNSVSTFEMKVGKTSNTTNFPRDFSFMGPGPGYSCSPPKIVTPTKFADTDDERRSTTAMKTWEVTCIYSQFLASRSPSCCVSLSAFYSNEIVPCNDCTCSCPDANCIKDTTQALQTLVSSNASLLYCTDHMCPARIHWHVETSYKGYWRAKITVTNFEYQKNHSNWNMLVQHPDFGQLIDVFSFNHRNLPSLDNDTLLLWGKQYYNDILMQATQEGFGVVQSEILIAKDKRNFSFRNGYAFPRKVYFNGDNCIMPPPDSYPRLPDE